MFLYSIRKFILFKTAANASVLHNFGKITKGLIAVASVTDLKDVSIIHKKGTIIVIDIRTNTMCITIVDIFLFVSILAILPPLIIEHPFFLSNHLEYGKNHRKNKKENNNRCAISPILINECVFIE